MTTITIEQLREMHYGQNLHHISDRNGDGTPARWRKSGKVKTWVTRPGEFRMPVKRGMRGHSYVTHDNIDQFRLDAAEALAATEPIEPTTSERFFDAPQKGATPKGKVRVGKKDQLGSSGTIYDYIPVVDGQTEECNWVGNAYVALHRDIAFPVGDEAPGPATLDIENDWLKPNSEFEAVEVGRLEPESRLQGADIDAMIVMANPAGESDRLVFLDPQKIDAITGRVDGLTWRFGTGLPGYHQGPVVAYRAGRPVAVVMPIHVVNEADLGAARALWETCRTNQVE